MGTSSRAFRLIVSFLVNALDILFTAIEENPRTASAKSDIRSIRQVVEFLSTIVDQTPAPNVVRIFSICAKYEIAAIWATDRSAFDCLPRVRQTRYVNSENEPTRRTFSSFAGITGIYSLAATDFGGLKPLQRWI